MQKGRAKAPEGTPERTQKEECRMQNGGPSASFPPRMPPGPLRSGRGGLGLADINDSYIHAGSAGHC
jgi:hypothetical protein